MGTATAFKVHKENRFISQLFARMLLTTARAAWEHARRKAPVLVAGPLTVTHGPSFSRDNPDRLPSPLESRNESYSELPAAVAAAAARYSRRVSTRMLKLLTGTGPDGNGAPDCSRAADGGGVGADPSMPEGGRVLAAGDVYLSSARLPPPPPCHRGRRRRTSADAPILAGPASAKRRGGGDVGGAAAKAAAA